MKQLLISVLELIGSICAWICPMPIVKCCAAARNYFYTGYLRHRFARMGRSIFVWKVQKLRGERFMHIGDGNVFESDLQLTAWKNDVKNPSLSIGNNCLFRRGCHISVANSLIIGDNLLTGTNVLITDNAHGSSDYEALKLPPTERGIASKGPIVIGKNVWLGNNVCVMPGVTIGEGVIIGANSVVTHDIPVYAIAAGVPAQIIKTKEK